MHACKDRKISVLRYLKTQEASLCFLNIIDSGKICVDSALRDAQRGIAGVSVQLDQ